MAVGGRNASVTSNSARTENAVSGSNPSIG
jgi:hypothetical protein